MDAELEKMVNEMARDPDLLDFMKEQYALYQSMKEDWEKQGQEMEDENDPEFEALIDSYGEDYDEKIDEKLKAATRVHSIDNGLDPKRHPYKFWIETLYRIDQKDWFLHGEGGPMSKYAISTESGTCCGWKHITPMTLDEARKWLEEHSPDQAASFFPE